MVLNLNCRFIPHHCFSTNGTLAPSFFGKPSLCSCRSLHDLLLEIIIRTKIYAKWIFRKRSPVNFRRYRNVHFPHFNAKNVEFRHIRNPVLHRCSYLHLLMQKLIYLVYKYFLCEAIQLCVTIYKTNLAQSNYDAANLDQDTNIPPSALATLKML